MGGASVRPSLALAGLLAPPLALAVVVAAMLAAASLGWHPLWPETPLTPSEAVALGDDAAFARMIGGGADPDAAAPVGAGLLDRRARRMTPLEAAVVRGREQQLNAVAMMGATLTGDTGRRAVCLAYEESPDLVPALLAHGAPPVAPEGCRAHQP
jgi:hypothetical protein